MRSGPPTPEHIDFHVEYARFVDAVVVVVEGKKSFEVIVALCSLFLCSRLYLLENLIYSIGHTSSLAPSLTIFGLRESLKNLNFRQIETLF